MVFFGSDFGKNERTGVMLFLRELRIAFGFLTVLPISPRKIEAVDLANTVKYFPVVGAFYGLFTWSLLKLLILIFPLNIAVWLTVFGGAVLNGFIHWDGFADTADGLGGNDPSKRLLIMKDSRLGAFGVIALSFLIVGKILTINKVIEYGPGVFISIFTLSRFAMAFQIYTQPIVSQGLLLSFKVRHRYRDLGIATIILLVSLISGWPWSLSLLGVAGVTLLGICWFTKKHFGGITGDILGASNELIELVCFLSLNTNFK